MLHVAETNFPAIKESPRRLAVEGKQPEQLTTGELRRYIRTQRRANHLAGFARDQVNLQNRYAFPLTCLIVVLLGIPLGMRVSRSGPLLGVGTALTLVVAFDFLKNITQAFGEGGRIPPVAAAWLTNTIFAGAGRSCCFAPVDGKPRSSRTSALQGQRQTQTGLTGASPTITACAAA